jgi:hypothetical protein
MYEFGWLLLGAVIASAGWWAYVRTLRGVISDLKNIGTDVKVAAAKVSGKTP